MAEWKALIGRVTVFAGPSSAVPSPSALDLYRAIWGGDPANFQSNPNPLLPTFAQGSRANLTVGCFIQQGRIDFNLNPPSSPPGEPDMSLALIEDTAQLRNELEHVIEFIGGRAVASSVSRVGLFLHFLEVAPSVEAANRALIRLMPEKYRTRITDEEDFIFQINTPRVSSIENVRVNHILKWSADRFQVVKFAVPVNVPGDARTLPPPERKDFIAASVTLDINNVPVETGVDPQKQSLLLGEGLLAVKEILQQIDLKVGGF